MVQLQSHRPEERGLARKPAFPLNLANEPLMAHSPVTLETRISGKHKNSRSHGLVLVSQVVLFREVPVLDISLCQARDDDEAKHHQVDPCEDFVDQSRLIHTKCQEACCRGKVRK